MPRKIFGPKKGINGEGGCSKFRKEELHKLNSSPNINRVSSSRRMGRPEHASHVGNRNAKELSVGKPRLNKTTGVTYT